MVEECGWQVPGCYTSQEDELLALHGSVGLSDISPFGKWDVKGSGVEVWECGCTGEAIKSPPILRVLRVSWNPEASNEFDGVCLRLTQDRAVFVTDTAHSQEVGDLLAEATTGCLHVTNLSSCLAGIALIGPHAGKVLSKLTSLNLTEASFPNLSCAQTAVAKVHTLVARLDMGQLLCYQLLFTRDYAEFYWDALTAAGSEYGIAPVGWEACRVLRGER